MKIRKTITLLMIAVFIAAVGYSFRGGNDLPGRVPQALSSNHPYELARAYQNQHEDNLERAIEHYREALKDPETAGLARFELGLLFYRTGEFEKAIDYLERLGNDSPDSFTTSKILGLCHFRLQRFAESLQHLKEARKLNSKDGEVLYFMGRLYEEENFAEEAKECFGKAIDASPRSSWAKQAKTHLQALQNGDARATVSEIEDDEVRHLITKAPGQEEYPDAGAVILLDQEKLTIHADMTQTREIHKVIKILNDRGKWRAEVEISYDSLDERVHVDLARTIRPDGKIVNVGKEAMRDLTLWGGFPMYSNAKYKVISMPEVEEGAMIEYKATVRSSGLRFDEYFSDFFGFQDYEPTVVSRYILEVPKGLYFKTHFLHTDPIQPRVEHIGKPGDSNSNSVEAQFTNPGERNKSLLRSTWEMKDVPAIKWERKMPGLVDISPRILVSSFPDWEAFSQWWWDLARNRIEADGAIREKVGELIRDEKTPEDRARAIFHYVVSEIRYVGLEYGEGGFRPHHAKEVFANKYGDCKDQAVLLVAMLREAGVSAYPTLIGSGMWDLQRLIPMSQFNHCIAVARIGGRDIWLDPTDETCSFEDLPGGDQGREVLVFFDNGGSFRKTPVLPPERNKFINEMEIQIKPKREITIRGKHAFEGWSERAMRSRLKWRDPRERIDYLKELVSEGCPGATLESCTFSPVDDLGVPLTIEYRVSAPEYVKRAGDLLVFRVPWLSNGTEHVAKEKRNHPLTWANTDSEQERVLIQIPEGYRVRYMPESFEVDLPFASYKLEYANGGGRIVLKTLKERRVCTIGVDQYPDYKKYEERIAKELDKLIILERIEG
jgi:Flp pilus assembly protein TadD